MSGMLWERVLNQDMSDLRGWDQGNLLAFPIPLLLARATIKASMGIFIMNSINEKEKTKGCDGLN